MAAEERPDSSLKLVTPPTGLSRAFKQVSQVKYSETPLARQLLGGSKLKTINLLQHFSFTPVKNYCIGNISYVLF